MQGTNGIGIKGIQQLPLATNIKLDTKSSLKEASRGLFLEKFEKIKSENVKEELQNIKITNEMLTKIANDPGLMQQLLAMKEY